MKKIIIVGPYPPPYGGISIHIQRILTLMQNREIIFLNTSSNRSQYPFEKNISGLKIVMILYYLFFYNFKLFHLHSPNKYLRLLTMICGKFKKSIYIHVHGASLEDTFKKNDLISKWTKSLVSSNHFLSDNQRIFDCSEKYKPITNHLIDAFLPPLFNESEFLKFKNQTNIMQNNFCLSMVGWFSEYQNQDLYGFDVLADSINLIKQKYQIEIKVYASVNGIQSQTIYHSFIQKIENYNIKHLFELYFENFDEVWPLYILTNTFVRPTNTDGSALSVKEALWLETPCIASDCVPRPDEVILFANRNADSLSEKIYEQYCKKHYSIEEKINRIQQKVIKVPLIEDIYDAKQ